MDKETSKKMYGWTKWGGARKGLVMEELDEWYCQACARKQSKEAPAYMMPLDEDIRREFVRVCAECKHEAVEKSYVIFEQVTQVVRTKNIELSIIANLLTLPSRI